MSTTIPHPETGNPVAVFARFIESPNGPGYVEIMLRAAYRKAWTDAALANKLLVQNGKETYPREGVFIDEIGPVQTAPGTYDEDGKELTAPEYDDRWHVNCRINVDLDWQPIALAWMLQGNDDAVPNKKEETRTLAKVSLIDPDTVKTPARVWF